MKPMKHRISFLLAATVVLVTAPGCSGQTRLASDGSTLQITQSDGGSVVTKLGYGIKVNDGSTLQRHWYVLNDPSAPVQLSNAGINSVYRESSIGGDYKYVPVGSITALKPISAYEVRFLLFDVFGDHMETLSGTTLVDLTGDRSIAKDGTWRAWETEVSEMLTVVAFVARARTADGRIWEFNPAKLLRTVEQVKVKLTEKELTPEREKPKP